MHNKRWMTRPQLEGLSLLVLLLAWVQAQDTEDVQINVLATPYTLSFTLSDQSYTFENITCRNRNGPEIIANEQHVCENLDPCSAYIAVVTVRAGESLLPSQTLETYTDYKEPTTEIISTVATERTIELRWQTTDGTCVGIFRISAASSDNTFSAEQLAEKEYTFTFKDLHPCQEHNITLRTANNASVFVDSDSTLVTTDYAEPGELTLNITNLSNGATLVRWPEPVYKTCIANYTFIWRRSNCELEQSTTMDWTGTMETEMDDETGDSTVEPNENEPAENIDECEWSSFSEDVSLRQFTLADLQGCDWHTIDVLINHNQKATETFKSAEKLPSDVSDPNAIAEATQLHLLWSVPKSNVMCVSSYKVKLSGPKQREDYRTVEQITKDTELLFEGLDPCGIYDLEIAAISLNGSAGINYQNMQILSEDQPSEVREPQAVPGAFSIELAWETPAYADLCIDGYRISGWRDNVAVAALSAETTDNTIQFNGLSACQTYVIQIIAYTRETRDGTLHHIAVETLPAIVNKDKISLQRVNAYSHSLKLNARNSDDANNCQTIFAFFNCSTTDAARHRYAEKYVEGNTDIRFEAILAPLSPYTTYICNVVLYNVAGPSLMQQIVNERTESYFPEQPESVTLINRTLNSLSFRWLSPRYPNGVMKLYHVYLMRYEPDYFVPPHCAEISETPKLWPTSSFEESYTGLLPAVKYSVQVAAENEFGMGQYTTPLLNVTLPGVSEPITDLLVKPAGPNPDLDAYMANVTVSWTMPCISNGEIEHFLLEFEGKRDQHNDTYFVRTQEPDTRAQGRMSYMEKELLPEYSYTVKVAVKTRNVAMLSNIVRDSFEAPAGIPAGLGTDVVGNMRVNTYETSSPTHSAIVHLPADILNSTAGTIKYIALLLSQNCSEPKLDYAALDVNGNWPKLPNWQEAGGAGNTDCISQYQTTPQWWQPSLDMRASNLGEITYTIGIGQCPDASEPYCNGPLQPDTEYHLVVRLFTKSGYNDAAQLKFKTDAAIKVTLILVSVCSCLLLAFVIGLVVLWVRKRIAWHRDSGQGIEDPFGNVIAKNFAIFYAEVAKPEKLAREFKEISVVALELSYAASELGNHKNRYADIYPYDKNRVILEIDSEGSGSDYINASFIDGHTRKKEYIATQGPKAETIMDFWRMISQYNVRIIVQVTHFREGNSIKCHEYFPYNMRSLSVRVKTTESFELYDRTELIVVHDLYGHKQKVIHFFFKKWPDHGCPDDPMHLITFVRKVKAEKRPSYSPIVVHCSAGVGRTGTFIGLDLIMQRLKSEAKINIFEIVKKLRFQRMKMVQTLQQYTFLYSCTNELVKHKMPRAALKCDARTKSKTQATELSFSTPKKVSFLQTNSGELEAPSGESADSKTQYSSNNVDSPI